MKRKKETYKGGGDGNNKDATRRGEVRAGRGDDGRKGEDDGERDMRRGVRRDEVR